MGDAESAFKTRMLAPKTISKAKTMAEFIGIEKINNDAILAVYKFFLEPFLHGH